NQRLQVEDADGFRFELDERSRLPGHPALLLPQTGFVAALRLLDQAFPLMVDHPVNGQQRGHVRGSDALLPILDLGDLRLRPTELIGDLGAAESALFTDRAQLGSQTASGHGGLVGRHETSWWAGLRHREPSEKEGTLSSLRGEMGVSPRMESLEY